MFWFLTNLCSQVAGHTVKCSWGKESGDPNNLPTNAQVHTTYYIVHNSTKANTKTKTNTKTTANTNTDTRRAGTRTTLHPTHRYT